MGWTFGRAQGLTAKLAIGQQPAHCPMADGSRHLVVIPPDEVSHGAGALIGWIGILHETGLCWRLFECLHTVMTAEKGQAGKMC